MKIFSLTILFSIVSVLFFGQTLTSKTDILSQPEISELFSDTSNKQFTPG